MNNDNIKVYINKTHSGDLSYEDEKYIFNYLKDSKKYSKSYYACTEFKLG